ncbi:MAG: acyltransferase [Wenzhouxiangellaceae bacterium]|nr:acyltransferase [Wenzhouxiangellaceae bacterium]
MSLNRRLRCLAAPILMLVATIVLLLPMSATALAKLLIPNTGFRQACRRLVVRIAQAWTAIVVKIFRFAYATRVEVRGFQDFDRDRSYMLICNHQSWVDVPALLQAFENRLPFYRFFVKRQLIWLPLIGIALWALEYPFIRFRSRSYLEKHPEKQGEGLETARRACQKIRGQPATIVNFPEGAIFTNATHGRQNPRYRNLLSPHAGGLAQVLTSIGDQLDGLLDVTIEYPDGTPGVWQFLSNRVPRVEVHVRKIDIPDALTGGDYANDPEFRRRFRKWLNGIWQEKDERLQRMRTGHSD